jgi:hypothetical protein
MKFFTKDLLGGFVLFHRHVENDFEAVAPYVDLIDIVRTGINSRFQACGADYTPRY